MHQYKIAHLLTLRDRVKFAKQLCVPGEFNGHLGKECGLETFDFYSLSIGKDMFVDPETARCPIDRVVLEVGIVLPDWYDVTPVDQNTTCVSVSKQWFPADLEVFVSKLTAAGYRVDHVANDLPDFVHSYVTRSK